MTSISSNNVSLFGYKELFSEFKELYDKQKLPNKIIFSGEKGIGKATFAYHLTNYIFSQHEENRYDYENNIISNNNNSFNLIKKNTHPNFFLVSNDEGKLIIQISKIREMINFSNKSSFNDSFKVIFIDNIENLNINSVNALLKIIEEPNNKIYFFLIHDSKNIVPDTLRSRCIKFNFFLTNKKKIQIVNKLLSNNFVNILNDDFKSYYNSPGDIILLYNFFNENSIDPNISIDDFLKIIVKKSFLKKSLYIKNNLAYFIELYFNKKITYTNSKDKVYYFYKYFLSKISNSNKFNLDIESVLLEFNGKILNG